MKKIMKEIKVTSCYKCPFWNNEYCNLGAGFVLNEWREKKDTSQVSFNFR